MNIVDTNIYIPDLNSDNEKSVLVEKLRKIDGVLAPRFNLKANLLTIAYDPKKASSINILATVRNMGYSANISGM